MTAEALAHAILFVGRGLLDDIDLPAKTRERSRSLAE
jgi:hypothetical protein